MIRLFDTLQRKKVEFVPRRAGAVQLYACGPTVYHFLHLGNARPLVTFDVVARHFRTSGFNVTYVRNVTDVDDKIIKRAAELGEPPETLVERFTREFHLDSAALGCQPPDVEPSVTAHMNEIVRLIERLVARGLAYESAGDVYFSVAAFPAYGQLSQQPLDELKVGARVEMGEKKREPLDFALWKSAKPGEPAWASPWGAGRPGWHIECSAMAERYFGPEFDLHGGGVDLTFPHHENERAQSLGANGLGTFARYWMHNGFVTFNERKISKSDEEARLLFDRAFKLRLLIGQHGGEAVRLFLLTTQYRNPINFEVLVEGKELASAPLRFPGLEEAERRLEYGYTTLQRIDDETAGTDPAGPVAPEAETWLPRLSEALDDDFNTAEALAAHTEALALANRVLDAKLALPKDVRRRTLARLRSDLAVAAAKLGLLESSPQAWLDEHRQRRSQARHIDPLWVEGRLQERASARAAKDFARADGLRAELKERGVEIMDGPRGTNWRICD